MAKLRLDERRVDALKPRKSAYDVRDRELKGFGVTVLPSGTKRYFVHSQHNGRRVWKIVGQAGAISVDEAREQARALVASIQKGNADEAVAPSDTPFDKVGDEVFRRYARHWKPSTLKVNRGYYRNHILPWFAGRAISEITPRDVQQWFASLRETPVAADRSAPILSVIMRQAEIYGYRPEGANPCAGIKRYRRQGRERFLSTAEIGRLGEVLERHEADNQQAVAIIRLLLLTGCRKGEIVSLKWSYCREGKLFLPDSKVGPRTVWLSSAAREILDNLPRQTVWVFPSPRTGGFLHAGTVGKVWHRVRAEADLRDVRLHDLRHRFASHAVLQGVSLPVVSRLLGHKRPSMTLRYAHVGDRETEAAAERIGVAISRALDGGELSSQGRLKVFV